MASVSSRWEAVRETLVGFLGPASFLLYHSTAESELTWRLHQFKSESTVFP